jgi:hypothetical protein
MVGLSGAIRQPAVFISRVLFSPRWETLQNWSKVMPSLYPKNKVLQNPPKIKHEIGMPMSN